MQIYQDKAARRAAAVVNRCDYLNCQVDLNEAVGCGAEGTAADSNCNASFSLRCSFVVTHAPNIRRGWPGDYSQATLHACRFTKMKDVDGRLYVTAPAQLAIGYCWEHADTLGGLAVNDYKSRQIP